MNENKSWFVEYSPPLKCENRDLRLEWFITPDNDSTPDEVVFWFFSNVQHRVPEKSEWEREVSDIGSHFCDEYYFREGYYEVKILNDKYHFIAVQPYL